MMSTASPARKDRDIGVEILLLLEGSRMGKTISEIAHDLDISRPTIYKYLRMLLRDEKVDRHVIGSYKAYTTKKSNDKTLFQDLYMALLAAVKDFQANYPDILNVLFEHFRDASQGLLAAFDANLAGKLPALGKAGQNPLLVDMPI